MTLVTFLILGLVRRLDLPSHEQFLVLNSPNCMCSFYHVLQLLSDLGPMSEGDGRAGPERTVAGDDYSAKMIAVESTETDGLATAAEKTATDVSMLRISGGSPPVAAGDKVAAGVAIHAADDVNTEQSAMSALLRDPLYATGVRKARELRDEGIFTEEEFVREQQVLARQSRARNGQSTAADMQEADSEVFGPQVNKTTGGIPFRTHPAAPGWREYTQVDGVKYYYNTNTKLSQWAIPFGKRAQTYISEWACWPGGLHLASMMTTAADNSQQIERVSPF